MLVTTSYDPTPEMEERARQVAQETRGTWVRRFRRTLPKLRTVYQDNEVLLVRQDGQLTYADGNHPPAFFHPSTALIRLKRLMEGNKDLLMQFSGAAAGDTVIDCTAGLASDAIVFSYQTGPEGRVTALESEPILYLLVREGLLSYDGGLPDINAAMRRVELICEDHLSYLRRQPDGSADIVYFDPMLELPVDASSVMLPLRPLVNRTPLSEEAVREAYRVGRKRIVLKEHRESGEFERLGFAAVRRSHSKIAYGVISL